MTIIKQLISYVFIHSHTGNVIGYLSLSSALAEKERKRKLDKEKQQIAIAHQLPVSTVYWRSSPESLL